MSCSHRKDEHNRPDTTIETLALQRSSLETLPMKQCEGPPSRRRVDGMATSKGINMLSKRIAVVYTVVCVGLVGLTPAHADTSQEAAFLAENQAAMDKMMAGMNIKPTGNVDHDFTAMMIPHHQGAIDMAQAELHSHSGGDCGRAAAGDCGDAACNWRTGFAHLGDERS
jgi:Domain of unknown function (DUF305)